MVKSVLKKDRKKGKLHRKLKTASARKKAQPVKKANGKEKKLLELEAYQNPEFTSRPEIVRIHLDKNGIILNVNKPARKIYGLKAKKMIGLPLSIFIHPDDVDETMALLLQKKHDEREKLEFHKNRHISNNGDIYYMSWISTLHFDKHGSLLFIDNVATGIMELIQVPRVIE